MVTKDPSTQEYRNICTGNACSHDVSSARNIHIFKTGAPVPGCGAYLEKDVTVSMKLKKLLNLAS